MSKKSTTTNTPGWSNPPATVATTNLQNMVDSGGRDASVAIKNQYARAEAANDRSYNDPLGGFTTADVRDKSRRAQNATFHQNLGMDLAEAAQNTNQQKFSNQAVVAGLTAPQYYNAKSVNKLSDPFGNAMQIANLAVSGATGGIGGSAKGG